MSADPFAKVKGMIQEMIEKLVKEAQEEAEHKAFCDKEMAETEAKKADKEEEVDDLNTKIDRAAAKIAKLKETIALLEKELGTIAEEQEVADETRQKEKDAWAAAKSDFEQGLEGVQMALEVLRDYYAEKDDAALLQGAQSDLGAICTPSRPCSKSVFAPPQAVFSFWRVSSATFCSAAIVPSSFSRSAMVSLSLAIFAAARSIFVLRSSTSSSLSAFLASVSAISLSQKALCSASSCASLTSFSIISWIMPFTLAKGSALSMLRERMRRASWASAGTCVSFARPWIIDTTRSLISRAFTPVWVRARIWRKLALASGSCWSKS